MRRVGAFILLLMMVSACLSSAELTGGSAPPTSDGGTSAAPPAPEAGLVCTADLQTDVGHCGACGNVCPNRANAYGVCSSGACAIGCNTAFADCDKDAATGCEVSLADNPNHCGSCGRSCAGGACRGGVCQPRTVATFQSGVVGLALGGDDIYVALSTSPTYSIVRMGKEGDGIRDIAVGLTRYPGLLAVDATHVYFTRSSTSTATPDGAVLRVPRAGGEVVELATGEQIGGRVRLDGNYAYYVTSSRRIGADLFPGKVRRVPVEGGTATDVMAVANSCSNFVVDGPNVYVTCTGDSVTGPSGSVLTGRGVFRCAAVGCGSTPSKLPFPENLYFYHLAPSGDSLFVGGSVIGKLAKAANEYTFFSATPFGNLSDVAADEARVYWLDGYDTSTLFSCPISGCGGVPDEIPLPAYANLLAVTKTAVYLVASAGSASIIQRVVR